MQFKTCQCGSNAFYMLLHIKGTGCYYVDNNGQPLDNAGIHDGLEYKDARKYYRCANCDRRAKSC